MRIATWILPLLLVGCVGSEPQGSDGGRHAQRIAEARPAGPPTDCVEINRIRSTQVLSDRIIDFELTGGDTLRNVLPNSCPGLGFEEAFSYATSLSRLCSVDIITVLHQGGGPQRGASCGLGSFQPVNFPGKR